MVLGGSGLEGRGVSHKNTLAFKAWRFFWGFSYPEWEITGRVGRVVDERDTGLPQRDKRGRKWGEIGVKGEKERTHPGFVCHAITDGESQTAGCGGGGE